MLEQSDLIKKQVLASEWGLSPKTLDNWRSQGVGPPYLRLRGTVRYSRAACTRWLAEQQADSGGTAAS